MHVLLDRRSHFITELCLLHLVCLKLLATLYNCSGCQGSATAHTVPYSGAREPPNSRPRLGRSLLPPPVCGHFCGLGPGSRGETPLPSGQRVNCMGGGLHVVICTSLLGRGVPGLMGATRLRTRGLRAQDGVLTPPAGRSQEAARSTLPAPLLPWARGGQARTNVPISG